MTHGTSELPDPQSAEVLARVNRLELRVDELDQLFPLAGNTPVSSGGGKEEAPLADWVETFFAATFARSLGGEHRWCSRWEAHPEAVFRLRALRQAQVVLRAESAMGDAVWLRDHLDPQLTALLSSRGSFALCSTDRHDLLPPLPVSSSEKGPALNLYARESPHRVTVENVHRSSDSHPPVSGAYEEAVT